MKRHFLKAALVLVLVLCFVLALTACNKGDGTHEVIVKYGDDVLVTLNVADGTKAELPADKQTLAGGYGFVGLFSDAELTQEFKGEITSDMILYAKFVRSPKFILVDANGGSDVDPVQVFPGETYTLTAPTYAGHTFQKYTRVNEQGKTEDFPLTGTYTATDNTLVKANWTINTYTVTLHAEGETDGKIEDVEYGSKVTLPTKSKTGYKFDGWFEKNADGTFAAEQYDTRTPVSADLELTARFSPLTYTIAVIPNGGSAVEDLTVTFDASYDLSSRIPKLDGYTFDKFLLNDEEFPLTGTYKIASDVRVKATWKVNTYTVTFKNADETAYGAAQSLAYGASVTAPVAAAGYRIEGVYTNKEFTGDAVDFATYKVSGNATFYVKVAAITYKITVINGKKDENVAFGSTYTLPDKAAMETNMPEKWTAFNGYKWNDKDGDAFAATGTYQWTTDIVVYADFEQNPMWEKSTVTFMDGSDKIDDATVDNGSNIAAVLLTVDTDKDGYKFVGWYKKSDLSDPFNAAKETVSADLILYAKYTALQYSVSFNTGSETVFDSLLVTYDAEYDLTDYVPEKRGYEFKYWTVGGNQFPTKAIYDRTDGVTLVAYYERKMVTVSFYNGVSAYGDPLVIGQYETLSGRLPVDPSKTGYRFVGWLKDGVAFSADAEVEENLELTANFAAIEYTMTIHRTENEKIVRVFAYDAQYDINDVSTVRAGYSYDGCEYDGDVFAKTGTYNFDHSIHVYFVWTATADLQNKETYFVETLPGEAEGTLVLLTDVTYTFEDYDSVEILGKYAGSGFLSTKDESGVDLAANKLRAVSIGTPSDLTITLKKGGNPDVVKKVKVAAYIDSMGDGSNMSAMLTNSIDTNFYMAPLGETRVEAAANCVLEVGVADFRPDLLIKTYGDKAAALTLTKAEMIVTVTDSSSKAIHGFSIDKNKIDFDGTILDNYDADEVFTVSFVPKYNINNFAPYVLKIRLNDGRNVYTNNELKEAYADLGVHKINVLSNIVASLTDADYYTDRGGTLKNLQSVELINGDGSTRNVTIDTGTPQNDYKHGVYARSAGADDSIVINGNYFEIDGSSLPYIDNTHDNYGPEGSEFTVGAGYRIANVQTGIFLYCCGTLDGNGTIDVRYSTGVATFNNLRIGGNNVFDSDIQQDLKDGNSNKLLKMSAAYIGMVVRGGTVVVDNISIKNTSMAYMLDGGVSGYKTPGVSLDSVVMGAAQPNETQAAKLYANHLIMDNSWANSIYCYDLAYMNLQQTKIGRSCGLAISCDDAPYGGAADGSGGYSNLDTKLVMDSFTATNLNNWIVGDEAWFVAYGMSGPALGAKTMIHNGIALNTGGTLADKEDLMSELLAPGAMGIIKETLEGAKMNFAILGRPIRTDATSAWAQDKDQGKPHIGIQVIGTADTFSFFYASNDELTDMAAGLCPDLNDYTTALMTQDMATAQAKSAALAGVWKKVSGNELVEDEDAKANFLTAFDAYNTALGNYAHGLATLDDVMNAQMPILLMYYQQMIVNYGYGVTGFNTVYAQVLENCGGNQAAAITYIATDEGASAQMARAAYQLAKDAYGKLMSLGRPYTVQSAAGMQVMVPVYYAHELTMPTLFEILG